MYDETPTASKHPEGTNHRWGRPKEEKGGTPTEQRDRPCGDTLAPPYRLRARSLPHRAVGGKVPTDTPDLHRQVQDPERVSRRPSSPAAPHPRPAGGNSRRGRITWSSVTPSRDPSFQPPQYEVCLPESGARGVSRCEPRITPGPPGDGSGGRPKRQVGDPAGLQSGFQSQTGGRTLQILPDLSRAGAVMANPGRLPR